MPPGKGLISNPVWWTLVKDACVAGHLKVSAEPRPLKCFHRGADCGGWDTTQAETLDVPEWNTPAAICKESMTNWLNIGTSYHLQNTIHNWTSASVATYTTQLKTSNMTGYLHRDTAWWACKKHNSFSSSYKCPRVGMHTAKELCEWPLTFRADVGHLPHYSRNTSRPILLDVVYDAIENSSIYACCIARKFLMNSAILTTKFLWQVCGRWIQGNKSNDMSIIV